MEQEELRFDAGGERLRALLLAPGDARALFVFAHGAGAGMEHPFMQDMAQALARAGVATFRYQFPYQQRGQKRPDTARVLEAVVRRAVAEAAFARPGLPLIAGGKSMGGRMTSQAAALEPLPGVRGIAFIGFPLHPPRAPATRRAAHLAQVPVPTLFVQGTRDELADLDLLRGVLPARATLHVVDGADHGFHVLKRSGRTDEQVREEIAAALASWSARLAERADGEARAGPGE